MLTSVTALLMLPSYCKTRMYLKDGCHWSPKELVKSIFELMSRLTLVTMAARLVVDYLAESNQYHYL